MLKISLGTRINDIEDSNGYGYATVNMLKSLQHLGYEVNPNDPTADVEIWFEQPQHIKWNNPDAYKISYHPWESTRLQPGWADIMNTADEVWTPSPLVAKWYQELAGITKPVYVYEHGVDPIWSKKERVVEDKLKFLHVGAEAARKGGTDILQAFRLAFPRKQKDVELNLKIISKSWNLIQLNKVNVINKRTSLEELIGLFHSNHVYAYPSYGEGFGLTPLQAMATGMPTITVPAWAPYAKFLDPNLSIGSRLSKSPWPALHPGYMLHPKQDDIIDALRYSYHNYDVVHKQAQAAVDEILAYYDWNRLTQETFSALEKRLNS